MRLLLDTHVALWAIAGDPRLPAGARSMIETSTNFVSVSTASLWEITIKFALARGRPNDMPVSGADALTYFRGAGYDLLPITPEHVVAVAGLGLHHNDPFDRLLVAQAHVETLKLLTSDKQVAAYGGDILLI